MMLRRAIILMLLALASLSASAAPSCVPAVYGEQVGKIYAKRTDEGRFAHFYCKAADGRVAAVGFACVHGSCLSVGTFFGQVDDLKQQANPEAAVRAAWDASFNSCDTASGTLKIVCEQMAKSQRENHPVQPVVVEQTADVWVVAPITSGSRPSRKVVNGELMAMPSPIYMPIQAQCAPSVLPTFVTTAGTWMAVEGKPTDLRWLCRKR